LSKEFRIYVNKKAMEKIKEESEPILKEIKDNFSKMFPDLINSKWSIEYKPLERFKFEIIIDELKILAERIYPGRGPYFSYKLLLTCENCGEEIEEPFYFPDIKSLNKILSRENFCINCQLKKAT